MHVLQEMLSVLQPLTCTQVFVLINKGYCSEATYTWGGSLAHFIEYTVFTTHNAFCWFPVDDCRVIITNTCTHTHTHVYVSHTHTHTCILLCTPSSCVCSSLILWAILRQGVCCSEGCGRLSLARVTLPLRKCSCTAAESFFSIR